MGFLVALVSGWARWRWGCRCGFICCGNTGARPQPFSSLMFFERRLQSSVSTERLRYLLLLALRLALLLLLALAFANPFHPSQRNRGGRRKLTVIAIDRSFSMRYGDRMSEAKAQARQAVEPVPGGGTLAEVVAVDSHVESLGAARA